MVRKKIKQQKNFYLGLDRGPKVKLVEVGARDGLQNEPTMKQLPLPELIQARVNFIIALANAGLREIEAGAFVRSDRVPQMQGTETVLEILRRNYPELWKKCKFWCLVPNRAGFEKAVAARASHISVFTATSEAFAKNNINMSIKDSLRGIKEICLAAKKEKIHVRGYISTVWGCPFSGKTSATRAYTIAQQFYDWGVEEVSLGDTIGVATPGEVEKVLSLFPGNFPLAVHFHDTRGTALANTLRALDYGIRTIDSSAGGLGGCPYAPAATGNLATEDLIYMLNGMRFTSGVKIDKVCEAGAVLAQEVELSLPSRFHHAWSAQRRKGKFNHDNQGKSC